MSEFRFRNRYSRTSKENAPSFAYKCIYGKEPSVPIRGQRYDGSYRENKGRDGRTIFIDEHLKDKWIKDLNNINNIEIRSTCEGHNSTRVAAIIFRPSTQDVDDIDLIVRKLSIQNTKALTDVGNGGLYRICVATKNWYRSNSDNSKWELWWDNIAKKIDQSVNR